MRVTKTTPVIPTEDAEQAMLFRWAALMQRQYPELRWLHAIPNGGYRAPATAKRLKATGVKAGVPDVFLPVPKGGAPGLWIEMKRTRGGVISPEQAEWIAGLAAHGHRVVVARGFEAARVAIVEYLES